MMFILSFISLSFFFFVNDRSSRATILHDKSDYGLYTLYNFSELSSRPYAVFASRVSID